MSLKPRHRSISPLLAATAVFGTLVGLFLLDRHSTDRVLHPEHPLFGR